MKNRNLIIILVGIILVGLFLITEIPKFSFNLDQSGNSHDNDFSSQNNDVINPNQFNNPQDQSNDKNIKVDNPSSSSNGNNT